MGNKELEQDIAYHLHELRSRVIHSMIAFIVLTAIGLYFSGEILTWMQTDLGFDLNALTAYETIYTQIMIGVLFGFFLSLPSTIYQTLKFAEPGLKPVEYRLIRNYLPFAFILFLGGSLFAYEFIVKASLNFFWGITEAASVTSVWGLRSTIGFVLKISAVVGLLFQLPIVSIILAKAGVIDSVLMRTYRAHFIIGTLIVAAISTPPDLITQFLITVPILGLYEVSILLVSKIE